MRERDCLAVTVFAVALMVPHPVPAIEITNVALTGDSAPGASPPFDEFNTILTVPSTLTAPVVDEEGRVAFLSALPAGLYTGSGGPLEKVVVSFDSAPGLPGDFFSLFWFWRGGAGHFVLYASVGDIFSGALPVNALYTLRDGGVALIAFEDGAAPGTNETFEFNSFDVAPQVGSGGEYAFSSRLEESSNIGIWAGENGSLELLMVEDGPAPGFDPNAATPCTPTPDGSGEDARTPVGDISSGGAPVVMARDGTLAMTARVQDCGFEGGPNFRDVLWRRAPGENAKVVVTAGQAVSGPGTQLQAIRDIAMSDGGTLAFAGPAFHGERSGNGVWSRTDAGIEAIVKPGDVLPGIPAGAEVHDVNTMVSVADSGRAVFQASLQMDAADVGRGFFAAGGGRPKLALAVQGSPAPGTSGAVFDDFVDFQNTSSFGSDAEGNVAFITGLEVGVGGVGNSNNVGLWRSGPDGPVEIIARKGDPLSVGSGESRVVSALAFAGESILPIRGGGIGPKGVVAFYAKFTDGTEGIFVTDEAPPVDPIPEPVVHKANKRRFSVPSQVGGWQPDGIHGRFGRSGVSIYEESAGLKCWYIEALQAEALERRLSDADALAIAQTVSTPSANVAGPRIEAKEIGEDFAIQVDWWHQIGEVNVEGDHVTILMNAATGDIFSVDRKWREIASEMLSASGIAAEEAHRIAENARSELGIPDDAIGRVIERTVIEVAENPDEPSPVSDCLVWRVGYTAPQSPGFTEVAVEHTSGRIVRVTGW